MEQNLANPRYVALRLLAEGGIPTRRFAAVADEEGLAGQDRGLARMLVSECLRRQLTLDLIWSSYAKRRVKDDVMMATLRLGILQLFYMDNIPDHAAIGATIEAAADWLGGGKNVANAILRGAQRGSKKEAVADKQPHRHRLILDKASWFFDRPIFHSHHKEAARHWAQQNSFPTGLARRWWEELGPPGMRARMTALNTLPSLWLRVNPLKTTRKEVIQAFTEIDVCAEAGPHPLSVNLPELRGAIEGLPGFAEGHWAVQDLTSLQTIALARPAAGERILDLCAAPGGKAFAAFELSGGEAEVMACDISAERLEKMDSETERLGHTISRQALAESGSDLPEGPWDLIVVDAPCTNTGVLNKRPEARWRFDKKELHRATTVMNLIRKNLVLPLVGEKTRVLWCTCSLEQEENQEMAQRLAKRAGLQIEAEKCFEPFQGDATHPPRSGGYAALLSPVEQDTSNAVA